MAARHHKRSAKNAGGDEYAIFENALKQVLSVSHSKIQSRILAEKRKKRSKRASASRVVGERD